MNLILREKIIEDFKKKYLNKKFENKPTATNFYQKKLNSKLKTYSVSKKRFEQLRIKF